MGIQSSRMIYEGKDIKDFYYGGMLFSKLYKGGKLIWEKLYPEECLITKCGYGILLFDINNRFFDVIPYGCGYSNRLMELSCVGNSLFATFTPLNDEKNRPFYSADVETFKLIPAIDDTGGTLYGMTNAYTDDTCLYSRISRANGVTIATYDRTDGKLDLYTAESYDGHGYFLYAVVGKGEYITCVGYDDNALSNVICKINNKAEVVNSMFFNNTRNAQIQMDGFFCVGSSIYVTGQPRYDKNTLVIGKINTATGIISWDEENLIPHRQSGNIGMVRAVSISDKEIVSIVVDSESEDTIVLSMREDGWSIVNTIQGGYVPVTSVDGGVIPCYIQNVYTGAGLSGEYRVITVGGHIIYMKDKKPIHDDGSHGLLFDADGRAFYFDNYYFAESDGNICSPLLYYGQTF